MRFLVTSGLIYANGDAHLGHLRSTYLPADIYSRYRRRRGEEVVFVSGTDDHGSPICMKAIKEKISPKEIADKYWKRNNKVLNDFGISFDSFSKTSTPLHEETTKWFFTELQKKKKIYEKEVELPYCPTCKKFLADRYLRGKCPYCGFENARGDECQNCGRALSEGEIIDPICYECKTPAEKRKVSHWFIKLSEAQKWLRDLIEKEKIKLPGIGKSFLLGQYLKKELRDISITRDLNWGICLPDAIIKDNKIEKVLYVWFDAPIGYIDGTKEWALRNKNPEKWKDFWLDEETVKIHFIGKGILYHHALFWLTILKGVGFPIPNYIPAYGHITLKGFAMSKEEGNVVYLNQYLEKYPADSLRYFLTTIAPLKDDTDFTWEEFYRKQNNELTDTLGNFIHRVLTFIFDRFEGKIPKINKEISKQTKNVIKQIDLVKSEVEKSIETFEFRYGLLEILRLAREGNKYFTEQQPWVSIKNDKKKAEETLNTGVQLVYNIAQLIEPYLPFTAEKIWDLLNFKEGKGIHTKTWFDIGKEIESEHQIRKPEILFQKYLPDKEEITKEKTNTSKMKELEKVETKYISYEEFSKMDLRLGKILSAKKVEGTDRLLQLKVDIGTEERQVIAGMGDIYKPEELEGLMVAMIVNLQPRKIKGLESQGMILAGVDGKNAAILKPDKNFPPGSKIM
ncbi:MAG: methionine--tRNA ligase [Candidatus Ranarchaeia archaeon]